MTKIFIGGSRHVNRLDEQIQNRLKNIVERRHWVLIGDANGADKVVQQYFDATNYRNVEVYFAGRSPRNNVGNWPVRMVTPKNARKDLSFYATKDIEMSKVADIGLMIWDSQSAGTLLNVLRLVALTKNAVVYIVPDRKFLEIRNDMDAENLVAQCPPETRRKIHQQLQIEADENALNLFTAVH